MAVLGPATVVAPLMAITILTGEWTTRNAMHMFVLEPRRGRIIAAKCCSAIFLAICTVLVGALISVVAAASVAASAGTGVSFQAFWWPGGGILSDLARVVMYTVLGMAIGALTRSTAIAITAFLALTILADPLIHLTSASLHRWLPLDSAITAVSNLEFSATTPLQALVGTTIWLLLPGVAGFFSYRLREAK